MKIAVLADIHANFVALQTITAHLEAWQPDAVIVAGDVVNRGPRPRACWEFVQAKQREADWQLVRGNHEDYVLNLAQRLETLTQHEYDFFRFTRWTLDHLSDYLPQLEAMPFQQSIIMPDGTEFRVVHASMRGNRDGVFPHSDDDELRKKIHPAPAVLCVGHTHWPLQRSVDETLIVNVGAVGLPFDRDRRASYAQFVWQAGRWQTEIIRLDYDSQQAERDFRISGFLETGGPLAHLILEELRSARSYLFSWTSRFQKAVLSGEITVAESVAQFSADLSS